MKIISNKRYKELLKAEEENVDKLLNMNYRKIKFVEDKNWEQFLIIEKLKEENKRLNDLLSKKFIEEIGEPTEFRRVK